MQDELFKMYLAMLGENEAPNTYHRWSLLTVLGAWLGRRNYLPFGDTNINCNMYVMLMGSAGVRKTTAINKAVKLIKEAGYTSIAANKTSKEKFLLDLAGDADLLVSDDILEMNLFGEASKEDAEVLVAAEEFNVFVGNGNLEFLALLGSLWDYDGAFENKVKNSTSAYIYNPTVSILAGNTATSFALAFPIEAIGQGIFSRLLLIHGDKTGRKITIPTRPDADLRMQIIKHLQTIRATIQGEIVLSEGAYKLLDKIYKTNVPHVVDIRFESYNNRRLTHLLKLALITAVTELSKTVTEAHVIMANTILVHAEHSMPKTLGEFGKAKDSDIANKILSILTEASPPIVPFKAIWSHVCNDLETINQLKEILDKLIFADKVMVSKDPVGFIAKSLVIQSKSKEVDFSLLTSEEQGGIIL
jgi:hypothetical protein